MTGRFPPASYARARRWRTAAVTGEGSDDHFARRRTDRGESRRRRSRPGVARCRFLPHDGRRWPAPTERQNGHAGDRGPGDVARRCVRRAPWPRPSGDVLRALPRRRSPLRHPGGRNEAGQPGSRRPAAVRRYRAARGRVRRRCSGRPAADRRPQASGVLRAERRRRGCDQAAALDRRDRVAHGQERCGRLLGERGPGNRGLVASDGVGGHLDLARRAAEAVPRRVGAADRRPGRLGGRLHGSGNDGGRARQRHRRKTIPTSRGASSRSATSPTRRTATTRSATERTSPRS